MSSKGRYFAILAIIALGVGFFTGLKTTKPAMMQTVENYIDSENLFDYKIISTIGISDEEVEKIESFDYIQDAEGSVYKDFIMNSGEEEKSVVFRAHSMPQSINKVKVIEGRYPQNKDECIVDYRYFKKKNIGETISIADINDEDTKAGFNSNEFKIVGIAKSSYYMNMERGTTTLGDGLITGYIYLPIESFNYEYYSECYVVLNGDEEEFSDKYKKKLDDRYDTILNDCKDLINERYENILEDANSELEESKKKLEDTKLETEVKLADARKELDDGWDKLSKAKEDLNKAKKELDDGKKQIKEAEDDIKNSSVKLDESKKQLDEALIKINEGEREYDEAQNKLVNEEIKLNEAGENIADAQTVIEKNRFEIELAKVEVENNKKELEQLKLAQLAGDTQYDEIIIKMEEEIAKVEESVEANSQAFAIAESDFNKNNNEYLAGREQYNNAVKQLEESKSILDKSKVDYENGLVQYNEGKRQLEEGKKKLENSKQDIINGEKEYNDGLVTVEENEKKLKESEDEYNSSMEIFLSEVSDAEKKIADGEKEIRDIENPEYFALDRRTNPGFACFENDSNIVDGIAKVFPVFFFLIAALVCSTTMTRMVDDERTQIGTFRALGYSSAKIMMKYIIYSGSSAIIGCVIGFYLGSYVFPKAIWAGYNMMYDFAEIEFVVLPTLLILDLVVSLLCSVGTTVVACKTELFNMPAELIRKKAPIAGKRILLERIDFIWKRMKFLHKVTTRNIFRFKKRMIMMIIGIAGCCALVLAGFGIEDSMSNIVDAQYGEIMLMDASVVFSDKVTDEVIQKIDSEYKDDIDNYALIRQASLEANTDGGIKSVYLVASEDENIDDFVNLHYEDKHVEFPKKGEVVISQKIAELMGVNIGDEVSFTYDESKTVSFIISNIFENYVDHYLFISKETYETVFKEEFIPQIMYINFSKNSNEYEVAAKLSDFSDVTTVLVTSEMMNRIKTSMESLDYIVGLVVFCAGALAFVVLFNLSNINISERIREIATIEVLGFYNNETRTYVFRENLVLTIMGIMAGLPLGIWLHSFIINKINVDMVTFQAKILPLSYVYTVVLVIIFTYCVDFAMRGKITKINMAEALKSVD